MPTTMNKIVVYFSTCSPAPAAGYKIYWRVAGTTGSYTYAGAFFISPATFYDRINPPGTCYEGYIITDCGNDVHGNQIPWTSCESGESGSDITIAMDNSPYCRSEGTCNDNSTCGIRFSVTTMNAPAGSYIVVTNTSGSATINVFDNDPANGVLQYREPNAGGSVTFDLVLKDSGGITIASQPSIIITHESFYEFLSFCES